MSKPAKCAGCECFILSDEIAFKVKGTSRYAHKACFATFGLKQAGR